MHQSVRRALCALALAPAALLYGSGIAGQILEVFS